MFYVPINDASLQVHSFIALDKDMLTFAIARRSLKTTERQNRDAFRKDSAGLYLWFCIIWYGLMGEEK